MTTNTHSNSVYYHGDCVCEKTITTSNIAIQCEYCIYHNFNFPSPNSQFCTCKYQVITHKICNECAQLRDKIDLLNNELDDILSNLSYDIKMCMNCTEELTRIAQISIELRNTNRQLLENLIE